MSRAAVLVLGIGLGSLLPPLCAIATTYWYETRYLARIAADFDPGPGLWLEKRTP